MNIEDIIQYTQKTPENTNPNILRSMLSSLLKENTGDFTTCQVIFTNNSEDSYTLEIANLSEYGSFGTVTSGGFGSEETASVILYKGTANAIFQYGNVPSSSNVSVSGDVVFNEDNESFTITGDGTITINY